MFGTNLRFFFLNKFVNHFEEYALTKGLENNFGNSKNSRIFQILIKVTLDAQEHKLKFQEEIL